MEEARATYIWPITWHFLFWGARATALATAVIYYMNLLINFYLTCALVLHALVGLDLKSSHIVYFNFDF